MPNIWDMDIMLTYEEFEKHITAIQDQADLQNGLNDAVRVYNEKHPGLGYIDFPSLAVNVVELLERLMGDQHEWISFWVWELDFGKEYRPGCVTDEHGKEIKLETIRDLYIFLERESKT